MDKGQILCDYRTAKNHKKQIHIRAELNACSKEEIIDILTDGGYTRTFNTNGVDISVKRKEIEDRYANGDDVSHSCHGISHLKESNQDITQCA